MFSVRTSNIKISVPGEKEFELVKQYVADFELDDREMQPIQFLIAFRCGKFLGFGRIRKHRGCDEFCTLGIVTTERKAGIGKQIVRAIIKVSNQPMYLACVIPKYFEPFGFKTVQSFPAEMQYKLNYCNAALPVGATYVVMQYEGFAKRATSLEV